LGFVKKEGWKLADRQEEIHLQEQAYLEAAHLLLDLEENFLKRSTGESGTEIFSATVLRKMWKRRLENLRDSRERLVLGAFERTIDGEIYNFHVGRFNVEIEDDRNNKLLSNSSNVKVEFFALGPNALVLKI
jgi:hypothetical protein